MGPALVCIHGYPFNHTMWDHVVGLMREDVTVLTPDLRGFDGKDLGKETPAIDVYAQDLAGLLAEQNISRAVVCGMSMGGYIALALAEHYPERLAGLALVSSHPYADSDEIRAGRRAVIQKVQEKGPMAAAEAAIPKMFAPANVDKPDLVRFPMLGAERAGVEGITWALEAMARRPDRMDVLTRLKIPILIVHGTEDKFIAPERARKVAEALPNAKYVEIPNAGHCTPLEAPQKVAQALSDFLNRCSS